MSIQTAALTVGTTPVQVPINLTNVTINWGLKMLARVANGGNIFWGTTNAISITTGSLLAQGAPATSTPTVVPPSHFQAGNQIWVVADTPAQVMDWTIE